MFTPPSDSYGLLGSRHGSHNIDIWKLRLDGTGKDFVRLTNFNDYEGFKASNPVVSTDGRFMVNEFREARAFTLELLVVIILVVELIPILRGL